MAKAVVDPAELRRFAQDLKRFNGNLVNQLAALQVSADETVWIGTWGAGVARLRRFCCTRKTVSASRAATVFLWPW